MAKRFPDKLYETTFADKNTICIPREVYSCMIRRSKSIGAIAASSPGIFFALPENLDGLVIFDLPSAKTFASGGFKILVINHDYRGLSQEVSPLQNKYKSMYFVVPKRMRYRLQEDLLLEPICDRQCLHLRPR